MNSSDIIEILNSSADLIERTGWTQGLTARDKNGDRADLMSGKEDCFCALGAIYRTCMGKNNRESVTSDTTEAFSDYLGIGITTWNDDPSRTKNEVIQTLRGCAKSLASELGRTDSPADAYTLQKEVNRLKGALQKIVNLDHGDGPGQLITEDDFIMAVEIATEALRE